LYLIQHLEDGQGDAVIPAPPIEGLTMRQGEDKTSVEYLDPGEKLILVAEAQQLDLHDEDGELLGEILYWVHNRKPVYARHAVYPRFHFPVEGVEAGFFGISEILSYQQLLRIEETLELFKDPQLAPMRPYIFAPEVAYIVLETLGSENVGANFVGTEVVILDRQFLFGNRYYLAEVIAHEGAHTLQGKINLNHECEQRLQYEVGNQVIPPDFERWPAEAVMEGVEDGSLGAYHVSYWMLSHLGFNNLDGLRTLIQTGRYNGEALIPNCPIPEK